MKKSTKPARESFQEDREYLIGALSFIGRLAQIVSRTEILSERGRTLSGFEKAEVLRILRFISRSSRLASDIVTGKVDASRRHRENRRAA